MSGPAEQPLDLPSAGPRPAAATQAAPRAADWSGGRPGPLRASGLPAPRPLAPRQAVPPPVAPTVAPAVPAAPPAVPAAPAPVPATPLPAIEEWTVPVAQAAAGDLSGWGTHAAAAQAPATAVQGAAGEWAVPAAQAAAPAEDWTALA